VSEFGSMDIAKGLLLSSLRGLYRPMGAMATVFRIRQELNGF